MGFVDVNKTEKRTVIKEDFGNRVLVRQETKEQEIAIQIVAAINPKKVLCVGCMNDNLVAAFRELEVDAYGIDFINCLNGLTLENINSYYKTCSTYSELPSDFPKKYDLLIIGEIVERFYEEEVQQFLDNLIHYSDDILLLISNDIMKMYNNNIQKPEYWCKKFAKYKLFHNLESDISHLIPAAIRFSKSDFSTDRLVENYEKYVRILKAEYKNDLNDFMSRIQTIEEEKIEYLEIIEKKEEELSDYSKVVEHIVNEKNIAEKMYKDIIQSTCWKITKPIRVIVEIIKKLIFKNFIVSIVRLFAGSLKHNGLKITLAKVKARLLGKHIVSPTLSSEVFLNGENGVEQLLNQKFRNLQPIPNIVIESDSAKFNLVTDSIDSNSLLGGVATAIIIATEFCRYCNIPLRIITRNAASNPENYKNILKISGIAPFENVEFYSDHTRDINGNTTYKLEVSSKDVFFATSWWSAVAIQKTSIRNRFFYIIQEVETFFYPHGDEHYLCSELMENKNIDFIINSKYLYQYYKQNNYHNIVNNGVFFSPAFPQGMYKPGKFVEKKKYKMFFYARPNNPRNMFYYGVDLLNYCITTGVVDTEQWDIYCAGQDIPEIKFSNGYKAINLGLMSWTKYGEFLSEVDVAVSLMYTPHPSYPPYDVACSGGVVLTNTCLNKVDFDECKNIILVDLDKDEFASGLRNALALAQDMPRRKANYENSTIPRSWDDNLDNVMNFMKEKLNV